MLIKKEKKIVAIYTITISENSEAGNLEKLFTFIEFNRLFEHHLDKPQIDKTDTRVISAKVLEVRFLLSVNDYNGISISRIEESLEIFNENLKTILNLCQIKATFSHQLIT